MTRTAPRYSHKILIKPIVGSRSGGVHADVYLPARPASAPIGEFALLRIPDAAICIHGGGFTMGKSEGIPTNQVEWLLADGYAVVSLEYRFAPHGTMDEIRQDILDGYKWILNDMNGTIGRDLDVSRVICMGWSAGATASLLLAADVATQGLPQFKAIIATYPLTNANTTHNKPISEWYDNVSKAEQEEIMSLFDEPVETSFVPEDPEWFKLPEQKSPRMRWLFSAFATKTTNSWLYKQDPPYPPHVSPIHHIKPCYPPTFIVVASDDQLIPTSQSYELHDALVANGVECGLAVAKGMGHGLAEAPVEVWPKEARWWEEAILPGLKWAAQRGRR